jgi:o-succinylbenzoate synthase
VVKVAAVRVMPVRLRFARPVRTARGEFGERECVLLEVCDPSGVPGYGEAAPWPGFGTETVAEAAATLRAVADWLEGREVAPGGESAAPTELLRDRPAARAALDGALRDLEARRSGRSLAMHLAASVLPGSAAPLARIAVSALLTAADPDELRDEAGQARAAGYRAAKLKLGAGDLATDVARVRAAREGLGPGVRLRADANGAWGVETAVAALAALAEYDLQYVEQPVAAHDIGGLAHVRRRAAVRVAADEAVASEQGLLRLIAAGAADFVVLKPATLGGPGRALRLAARARESGLGVVFTHAMETAIGARHALHCAAAWGEPDAVHGLQSAGLFDADVAEGVSARAGYAEVTTVPGLGVTL